MNRYANASPKQGEADTRPIAQMLFEDYALSDIDDAIDELGLPHVKEMPYGVDGEYVVYPYRFVDDSRLYYDDVNEQWSLSLGKALAAAEASL